MASIRKRFSKWQVQVRRKGFPPRIKTFGRKADAVEWARQTETKVDRGELEPDRKILEVTKLCEIVVRYRDEIVPRKRGRADETIVLNAFLRHPICKTTLSRLSSADFAAYRDERLRKVSPQTLKRQLTPIKSALNVAINEWEMPLRQNPLASLNLAAADNRRARRLSIGEFDRLLEAIRKTRNPYLKPILLFALETAMRRGEILAMRWDHVDLQRRSLTIPEAKNGHSRAIPLSKMAVAVLSGLSTRQGHVFPITAVALRLAWVRLTARAGLDDLHFHDLRHEAISRFFELGLTVPEVATISGHRDIRMLMRYAHSDSRRLATKLDTDDI